MLCSEYMDGSRATAPSSAGGAQFPAGLRVLVVDDDPTCLKITEKMLHRCLYDVTTCSQAEIALSMLRERKDGFDVVLSDVYMPDMDGFKLLELIGLEMDLPVIMMSADDGKELVMKGVKHGACDYLIKPVSMEALKNIWQHVVRKRKNEFMDNDLKDLEQSGSVEDTEKPRKQLDDGDYASSASEANWKNVKRRKEEKEEDDETEEHVDSSTLKKPRVVWSIELHQQFVAAVNQLGVDKAVPKKILELMNVPGLTRENVASHLQKYRLYLRRVSASQHHSRNETHFSSMAEATYSLDRLDLQALAVSGQITPQHLASYQTGPRRVANNGVSVPITNQMNFLNCDTQIANASKIKATSVQEWNSKQMNIRSGSSADMVPRQLGQPQQIVQSYGNMGLVMNQGTSRFSDPLSSSARSSSFHGGTISGHQSNSSVMQMTQQGHRFSLSQQQNQLRMDVSKQPQSKGLLLNGIAAQHDSRFPSTIKQHILSNEISDQVYGRGGAAINGDLSVPATYINTSYSLVPQASYPNFQNSCMVESVGNCYPHIRTVGSSTLTSSGMFQEGTSSGNLESDTICFEEAKDLPPSYDLLNEICQGKNQDWKLQAMNLPYESSQHLGSQQSNMDFGSSLLAHQDHITALNNGNSRNTCTVSKVVFPVRTEIEHGKIGCIAQRNSTILLENSVRPKAESMPDLSYQEMSFAEPSIPNELLDIIGEQQQGGFGQVDPEFNFDSYHLDDVLV